MHDLIFKCHVTAQQLPGLSGVNEIQTQKQIKSNDLFEAERGFGSINKRQTLCLTGRMQKHKYRYPC